MRLGRARAFKPQYGAGWFITYLVVAGGGAGAAVRSTLIAIGKFTFSLGRQGRL